MLRDGSEKPRGKVDLLDLLEPGEFGLDVEATERLRQSKELAKAFYTLLDYHNWSHILAVEARVLETSADVIGLGVEVDVEACLHAAYWHDSNFDKDYAAQGFTSKERYSASLALSHLSDIDVPFDTIDRAVRAISCTQRGIEPESNEDMLVSIADLFNIAMDQETFFVNTVRLAYEKHRLGASLRSNLVDYLKEDFDYLMGFFKRPFYFALPDGTTIVFGNFYQRAIENINSITELPIELFEKVLGKDLCRDLPASWFVDQIETTET